MKITQLFFAFLLLATAQEMLTNDAILKMAKGGVGEEVIVSLIQSQPGSYNLASDEIVRLKQLGLTDKVLSAMIAKGSPSGAPTPSSAAPTTAVGTQPPTATAGNGKLPFQVGHWHVGFGCHSCDAGPIFVTRDGVEFRGSEHSFKWRNDDIKEITSTKRNANTSVPFGEEVVETVQIKLKGDSRSYLFVECGIESRCRHPRSVTMLRDSLLLGLGRKGGATAAEISAFNSETPAASARATLTHLTGVNMLGSKDAPITIVEYTDYQCPFCQRFQNDTFAEIKRNYIDNGKVRFFSKDLPLIEIHKNAVRAAMAARCAGEQNKFWELREAMVQNADKLDGNRIADLAKPLGVDTNALIACVEAGKYKSQVESDIDEAKKIGVDGTPAFIIGTTQGDGVEGEVLVGAQPLKTFDEKLKNISK